MFLEKKEINKEMAEDILRDIVIPGKEKKITSALIIDAVIEHFHLDRDDLLGKKRNAEIVYPRKIAMYLIRTLTNESQQAIADVLNRKDHTTVISACRNIEKDMNTQEEVANDVSVLIKKIKSGL